VTTPLDPAPTPSLTTPPSTEQSSTRRQPQSLRDRRPGGFLQSPATTRASASAVISYDPDEVYTIYTKVRFVTALVFPEPEHIIQVLTGDKDWWQCYVDPPGSGTERIIYVKPTKHGIATNLTAIGSTGNIYQFFLQEISRDSEEPHAPLDPDAPPNTPRSPDVRVSIHLGEQALLNAQNNGPKFVPKAQFDSTVHDYQEQLASATSTVQATRAAAQTVVNNEVTKLRSEYPAQLQFVYNIPLNTPPFHVQGMFADDKFTYIKVATDEVPAIYEIRDGKPNLVQFDFNNGVYIVRKVLDEGYLAIGKTRLRFTRKSK
jgi:type IV secretion system protein VirB9